MAQEKYIEFEIGDDGQVDFEGFGFDGKDCSEVMKYYQKALGATVSAKKKAEYYQKEKAKTKVKA